jgi:HSP20 family protein
MTFPNYYLIKKDQPYDFNSLWDHLGFSTEASKPSIYNADILEAKDKYLIHMDVPGVKEEALTIELADGVLTVSGERKSSAKEEGYSFSLRETNYGKFKRSFRLNEAVQEDAISASLKDGILTIQIPKTEEKKPRIITVNKSN